MKNIQYKKILFIISLISSFYSEANDHVLIKNGDIACVNHKSFKGQICADVETDGDSATLKNITSIDLVSDQFIGLKRQNDPSFSPDFVLAIKNSAFKGEFDYHSILSELCAVFFGSDSKNLGYGKNTWSHVNEPGISNRLKADTTPIPHDWCSTKKYYGGSNSEKDFSVVLLKSIKRQIYQKKNYYFIDSELTLNKDKTVIQLIDGNNDENVVVKLSKFYDQMESQEVFIKKNDPKNIYNLGYYKKTIIFDKNMTLSCLRLTDRSLVNCKIVILNSNYLTNTNGIITLSIPTNSKLNKLSQLINDTQLDGYNSSLHRDYSLKTEISEQTSQFTLSYKISSSYLNCGPYQIMNPYETDEYFLFNEKLKIEQNSEGYDFKSSSIMTNQKLLIDLKSYYSQNIDPYVVQGIGSGYLVPVGSFHLDNDDNDFDNPSEILNKLEGFVKNKVLTSSILDGSNTWGTPVLNIHFSGYTMSLNCRNSPSLWKK